MFKEIISRVPATLMNSCGKVFYSGRSAFDRRSDLYVLGFNPGGNPEDPNEKTVEESIRSVVDEAPNLWSAYCDERWKKLAPGMAPLQKRMRHLFKGIADLRTVPSSNLIFARSSREAGLGNNVRELEDLCWPFHETVIRRLSPKVIICLGDSTGRRVRKRVGALVEVDRFVETNDRQWTSRAHRGSAGPTVITLTHPGVVDWKNTSADPTPLVRRVLDNCGIASVGDGTPN